MKLCLALLSGGSAVGQNVLFSLAAWRHRLRLIATTSVADEPALFAFDSVYLVPPTANEGAGFDRCVVDLIAAQSPDLVIPCREDDVRYLGALADRDGALASRLMCGNAASAGIVSDKVRGHAFCVANDLPFVPSLSRETIATRDAFVREHGFPLLAKPRLGWASRDVRLLWTEAQVDRALERDCVVQRFLGARTTLEEYFASIEADGVPLLKSFMGEKHSIQMLVGPRGDVREVMAIRVRKDLRSRSVVPDTTPSTLALGRRCAEALSRAGWRGPLNIQCGKDAEGTLWIHEFNGRFTGVTADRALLGHNEVAAGVTAFTGFAFDGMFPAPATMSIASLVSRAADPQAVRTLAGEGFWQRRT